GKTLNEHYDVRLSGGDENEGRVEVYLNGSWGGICNAGWDVNDVGVVCRQLGFHDSNLNSIVGFRWYGRGEREYSLTNVDCNGTEDSLKDCGHVVGGDEQCKSREKFPGDAVAVCKPRIRLVGGPIRTSGRLEIFYEGAWRPVCYYQPYDTYLWYHHDFIINTLCEMAGVTPKDAYRVGLSAFGPLSPMNTPIWSFRFLVTAQGGQDTYTIFIASNSHLWDGLQIKARVDPKCVNGEYVSLICRRPQTEIATEVRIVGTSGYSGKV
ncbi:unnamed protein product, partial [Owenia fusiformis]